MRLTEPGYDPNEETLTYTAEIISHDDALDYLKRHAGEDLAARVDEAIPQTFGYTFVYIHSKEPVEAGAPMSATVQRLSASNAVVALSAPSASARIVAYQAAASTSSNKLVERKHFQGNIEHVADIEGTLVLGTSDVSLFQALK